MKWISCMCTYIPSFLDIHSTPLHPTHVIIREHQSELPVLYSKFPLAIYFMKWSEVARSWPTLCNPIDGSPPGSPVPGILQARTLEWVAISFSNAAKWKVKVKLLSRVQLLATPWTAAYQAPPSMEFSRQEYWSGLPFPSPKTPLRK